MTNSIKIIAIADSHIGADRFGAPPERWDSPVAEAFQFAVDNKADLVLSAGDFMDKRNPTVAELLRRRELLAILGDIPFWEADGNHDRSNAEGSHSALEIEENHPGRLFQGAVDSCDFKGVNIIGLPWPRLSDYFDFKADEQMSKFTIDQRIEATRNRILAEIERLLRESEGPVILFGHAMLSYGRGFDLTAAQDPGLILGKDVLLPYEYILDLGLTENQMLFGHVHQSSPGYIGSTHATDWSDWQDDKSFVELDITKHEDGWHYAVTRHSYSDQIRLHDIVLNPGFPYEPLKETPVDVARVTINLAPGGTADEAALRKAIEDAPNYARLDRVIINHPKREAVRVETETPMADMPAGESFELWMKQAGYSADEAAAPYKEFESLIESSK